MGQTMPQARRHVSYSVAASNPPRPRGRLAVLSINCSVYIGLRDIDAGERKILKENGIKAFTMHEVDRYGIGKVVEMAFDHVNPGRDKPTHLSFDVDALDPTVAPSE